MPDKKINVEVLELERHNRHRPVVFVTAVLPLAVTIGLFFITDSYFYLTVSGLFIVVGAVNLYLMESRPVPARVLFHPEGIQIYTSAGRPIYHGYADIQSITQKTIALRGRQHMAVYFQNSSEPLYLYAYAMRITRLNEDNDPGRLRDWIAVSTVIWDRPMRLARSLLSAHRPDVLPPDA
ncbi:MAG: hypothetical protein KDK30_00925 [Leptospiraceae bacterium]|nr:hypothetical protein [Leptospiraceae bacterium]